MAKFTRFQLDEVAPADTYQGPRDVTGVRWSRALQPEDYSIWLCESELEDGATITWSDRHGDDAVYVFGGELEVEGHRCPTGGAVIVEAGHATQARAVGTTRIAHFGPVADEQPTDGLLGPALPDGHGVHVMGPDGHFLSGQRENVNAVWFADSTCNTCRCALLLVESVQAGKAPTHHHTEDEIIFLIDGAIKMGAYDITPHTSLCIPADMRYSFSGDEAGYRFLNYRRDASNQINDRSEPPMLETAAARGGRETADFR